EGPAVARDAARKRRRSLAGVGPRPHGAQRSRIRGLRMMLALSFAGQNGSSARALAIGAHPDDIEIGCAGTLLKLIEASAVSEIRWGVLSGEGERAGAERGRA